MVSPGMRVIKNKNKPNALRIGLQANSLFLFFFSRYCGEQFLLALVSVLTQSFFTFVS